MSTLPVRERITVEDLQRLDEDARIEVVNGRFVEQPMTAGFLHVTVIENLFRILDRFTIAHNLGHVKMDGLTYVLKMADSNVQKTRLPDLSYIKPGRIPANFDWSQPFPGAPDLAVEVVSPNEDATELQGKIRDYFEAGTEEVWVIYPEHRTLHQYRRADPTTVRLYNAADTLEPEGLFPGLALQVADLFVIREV